jgi:protein-S-isoprenylcysteine O-methyltransferase Ste14
MVTTVILVAGSVPLVWFSRRSLLHPAAHGFPRFFAFEATLALVATARVEEGENLVRFGREYGEYMKRSRRFVPFLF